uniref:SCP domain-containing protein n=1 Tax=Mesocestoides corti TaxID=53468 RepID=A0A5K3EXX4_MESCO
MQVFIFLLALSWRVLAEVPSEEDRKTIMECHTKLREEVKPTASNMQLMMVRAKSTQVGCAFGQCITKDDPSTINHLLTCAYKPSEIMFEEAPYEEGASCSKCPDGYRCHRNQCYTNKSTSIFATHSLLYISLLSMLLLHNFK